MRTALFLALLAPLPALAQVTVELGPEEIVMAWNDGQRCGMEDIPDLPARAFVDASGRVHLMAGHFELYQSTGDNLKAVVRDCSAPALSSHHDPDPRHYDDVEWLASTYTLDGSTVYGLVHDEYHGWEHGNCSSSDVFNCWWNAVTLIVSRDGGTTFRHVEPLLPPANVIASSPYDYDPGNTTGPFGFFEPSNILSSGGHYYALLHVEAKNAQTEWGACLMRTDDLADPASWRGWNGSEFSIVLDRGICPVLQQERIGKMASSLSYNGYLGEYLLVGTDGGPDGFHFTASESLTSWPRREVLMPTDLWWTPGATVMRGYPSLLQPGDSSRNFERTGRSPYLYYTHWDTSAGAYARDLVRRRVRFSLPGDEGRYQVLDLPMNERRGTVTLDASFYGNDAVLENGAAFTLEDAATGPAAVRLPAGTGAQLRVPDAPILDRAGSLTIEAFVRVEVTPAADATVVEKQVSTLRNYGLYVTSRTAPNPGVLAYSFTKPGGGLAESVGTRRIDDGRWHHVAAVHDAMAMTARFYVDGTLDVERPLGVPPGAAVNDSDLVIGAGLAGAIDAVVVHDHARTPQEILEAALGAGVELCNGRDDDADGTADDGFACVQGAVESRACASAPGGIQSRTCASDCSVSEWPECADVIPPPGEASRPREGCGCGMGGEPSLAWILLAALELRRRRCAGGRAPRAKT